MKRCLLLMGVLGLIGWPAVAQDIDFYLAVDIPADVTLPAGSTTVLPWTLVRHTTGTPDYTFDLSPAAALPLPLPTSPDALHLRVSGDWLFSVDAPLDDPGGSGTLFAPDDVVVYRPAAGTYSKLFCGSAVGVPRGADVDAAFVRGEIDPVQGIAFQRDSGSLVLSFDAPLELPALAGVTVQPGDLVEFVRTAAGCSGWTATSRLFRAAAAGLPRGVNVVGADQRGGAGTGMASRLLLAFDVPVDEPGGSGTTFLPGDVVAYDPGANVFDVPPFHRDPIWPTVALVGYSSLINAFTLLAPPGRIQTSPMPAQLLVDKDATSPATDIVLNWSASCSVGAEDYGVHEGTLPPNPSLWVYDHDDLDCFDDPPFFVETVTTTPVAPGSGTYYLVVPHNANDEGSFGLRSAPPLAQPAERPPSAPGPNCADNMTSTRELSCP